MVVQLNLVLASIFEITPFLWMVFYLWLSRRGVYDRLLGTQPGNRASVGLKQKDLIEFGFLQMFASAGASSATGDYVSTLVFVTIGFAWLIVPYVVLTLTEQNLLAWVKRDLHCLLFLSMLYLITAGVRFVVSLLSEINGWVTLVATLAGLIAAGIAFGEYTRESEESMDG